VSAPDPTAGLDEGDLRAVVGACVEAFAEHAGLTGPRDAIAAQLPEHVVNHLLRLRRVTAERDALERRIAALEGRA